MSQLQYYSVLALLVEHHNISVESPQIVYLMACSELLQIFLWDSYNTAEVLQVESLMNNGEASVLFVCCVDTDTVAALLMGSRLSWEVAFFTLIFINQ